MINYFTLHSDVNSELVYGDQESKDTVLSIVVPTYKRFDMLKKTIQSIINQKKPKEMKYHVIIVSNDPEFDWCKLNMILPKEIFTIYRNKSNLGMVGNMNRCAFLAKGKYIAYVQDDDVLLDDYIVTVETLLKNGIMDKVDCLIPNRYYYYDKTNRTSNFGERAYKSEKKKVLIKKIVSIGVKRVLLQKVTPNDCAETWYNCYGGGPTCGVLFKRSELMRTNGFSDEYPFVFDYVFFIDFSKKYNVCLYDKYLSVYRMVESASNRPDVQADFYRGEMYLLGKTKSYVDFVKTYEQEIIRFSRENKSLEAQQFIEKSYRINNIKYVFFRVIRFVYLMRRNLYRRNLVPDELKEIL